MAYDPSLSHFDLDMKRGAQGELLVTNIRDMLAKGSGTVEVKADYKFIETGRFYVETECQGRDGKWRPSGLSVTKASLWSFTLGDLPATFIVETEWLRRAAALAANDHRNRKSMDYGQNPTRGVLVYINHILKTANAGRAAA